ncbi:CRISPR-associated endoribonuclease Cas6 [Clostridium perfringens]|uniref:CRISPR-associated endoribonuclease Cas6 n=1 Tax=Clostridium perfringens TaxID=1502 RepID=UPI0021E050F4|nr:CRISPR-associated endoribonuclease Cas6 [Clostridium perfringens]MDK0721360.1 CRISPR-associated endoribonuclease Cas6 [Clostridium perfringens]MDK0768090.1 CRISPR-associated endoribonuclease Cas6 [Clostridium perfringens]MDK0770736.1 CRISPR-associated endoribonuclease Cas6 [Clostridium perfringens]MDK0775761.1 CRISPR-associated endoribonuclease Cas6 [Clostridium perfringens]UYC93882.1 CRISPR-associated endoribonuclease Cas6 [Clostridium perfringens]
MLQRAVIKLRANKKTIIDYDYNYALMCEVYKKIDLVDKSFSEIYHKNGLRKDNSERNFKLLNVILRFSKSKMDIEGIHIYDNSEVYLILSGKKDIIAMIINGFCLDNKININNKILEFESIIFEKEISKEENSLYKVETCLVESIFNNNTVEYLDIKDERFCKALENNLRRKYKVLYHEEYLDDLNIVIKDYSPIKRKSIGIKGGYIHGFSKVELIVLGNKKIQDVAYYCGLGSQNMMGAGFVSYKGGI